MLSKNEVSLLLRNYESFLSGNGRWENVIGISDTLEILVDPKLEASEFNLWDYIRENSGIALNPITAVYFMNEVAPGMEEDDIATGYLGSEAVGEIPQIILRDMQTGRAIVFTTAWQVLGRGSKNTDVQLKVEGISRSHLSFGLIGGQPTIQDNNSMNGTFVNQRRLNPSESVVLSNGDKVTIANEEFEVQYV